MFVLHLKRKSMLHCAIMEEHWGEDPLCPNISRDVSWPCHGEMGSKHRNLPNNRVVPALGRNRKKSVQSSEFMVAYTPLPPHSLTSSPIKAKVETMGT